MRWLLHPSISENKHSKQCLTSHPKMWQVLLRIAACTWASEQLVVSALCTIASMSEDDDPGRRQELQLALLGASGPHQVFGGANPNPSPRPKPNPGQVVGVMDSRWKVCPLHHHSPPRT